MGNKLFWLHLVKLNSVVTSCKMINILCFFTNFVLTDDYNVMVNSGEIIGPTIYDCMDQVSHRAMSL
jgi:hypothetical protein